MSFLVQCITEELTNKCTSTVRTKNAIGWQKPSFTAMGQGEITNKEFFPNIEKLYSKLTLPLQRILYLEKIELQNTKL